MSEATATEREVERGATMRPVDELVADLEAGDPAAMTVGGGKRCLDIEVLADIQVDLPDGIEAGRDAASEVGRALRKRYLGLRDPFSGDSPQAVITRGVRRLEGAPELTPEEWSAALASLTPSTGSLLSVHPGDSAAAPTERAAILAVDIPSEEGRSQPFAYVLVLGWGGDLARDGGRAAGSERLIRVLASTAARNAPLYVFCVTDRGSPPDGLLRECERLRVSLVLTAASIDTDLVKVSRSSLRPHHDPVSVAVVHCPTFKAGVATSGMARVRIDLWKGEAEIAFRPDLGSDKPVRAVQVTSQLTSASRISAAERRLYGRVGELLDEQEVADAARAGEIDKFRARVEEDWRATGYVTLCSPDGRLPIKSHRPTTYKLLLLARARPEPGRYDMLLSNHSPLRPSLLSEWNTLLLPAFKDARSLLEYLRDDVIRQIRQRAESFERVAHARAFEAAVQSILRDKDSWKNGLWADQFHSLGNRDLTAISPTTGVVTEYSYELVTPKPLVEPKMADDGLDEKAAEEQRDRAQVIEWLQDLDAVEVPRDGEPTGSGLSLGALSGEGCGVRWDPASGLAEDPSAERRRRAESASPGTIWFPLSAPGEEPHWKSCPSIVSRNADVMTWVEEVLASRREPDGSLPPTLLLGGG